MFHPRPAGPRGGGEIARDGRSGANADGVRGALILDTPRLEPPPLASSRRRPGPIAPGVNCYGRHQTGCENESPRRPDERNCAHAGVPAFAGTTCEISRLLRGQLQFEIAKADVILANPFVQVARCTLLAAPIGRRRE